jgi:hypothetical protein
MILDDEVSERSLAPPGLSSTKTNISADPRVGDDR